MSYRAKRLKLTYLKTALMTLFLYVLLTDGYKQIEETGENYFHIFLNGTEIGTVGEKDTAEKLLVKARREVASRSDELVFIDVDMSVTGEEILWGELDDEALLLERMQEVLRQNIAETMHRSYTVKVNEYMVNLGSADEVHELLQAAVDKYDDQGLFGVDLIRDPEREFNVLTASVVAGSEKEQEQGAKDYVTAGVETVLSQIGTKIIDGREKGFDDFDLGLKSVGFAEEVEIVEAYLPERQLSTVQQAIDEVIKEQETPSEYTIVAGDTLSEIAIKVNIPMDKIIELNGDKLENENSVIHVDDKLIITVPEPELSVTRMEENYYEEIYDADVVYIENNNWYTNQTKVHQEPSAGFRRIVADVYYLNDREVAREILKEEVVMEAVAKIVERGTKIPPTYIKPISGGRLTSNFGHRKQPKKGASTNHKGVDWAVPTGTAVYASCGGTVSKAGWGSGYGYVIYIDHSDGKQTRYGHLSKVLVSAGQQVKQGEKIALSGNTGVSTGPHLHFEILVNGSQVDPFKYVPK